jgi:hypothetical protein
MSNVHIRLSRLESRKWNCKVTTDGTPQSLTGCTITFTVKKLLTTTDSSALFQLTIANGGISISDTTGGLYDLTIGSTATQSVSKSDKNQSYHFDHRIKLPSGAIKLLEEGDFVVTPNVTDTMA